MEDRIIVIGAGGHAKVVIATARECGINVSLILDDDPGKWGKDIFGIRIKGPISAFKNTCCRAIMAIGDNKTREKMVKDLADFRWVSIIHPHTYVHETVKVGNGTVIFAGSVIQPDVTIGEHCIINTGTTVDHDCHIGDFSHLAPGTHIAGGATIGRGAFLGVGTKVVVGRKIGDWAVIGAGGLVLADVPSHVVASGVPAQIKKKLKGDT